MNPDDDKLPPDFDGVARLFPLPNLVLFPGIVQPLRIFEPRYREMLQDAMDADCLITIVKLAADWHAKYHEQPEIEQVGCIGRVVAHAPDGGGESNILLRGLQRVRIVRELDGVQKYRRAEVELLDDCYDAGDAEDRRAAHLELRRRFRRLIPASPSAQQQIDEMFNGDTPLGKLTDLIAVSANLGIEELQGLLAEANVESRARLLLQRLERDNPPPPSVFSNN